MSQSPEYLLELIHERTSIREYSKQKVEPEKVEALLRAAMSAPSSRNIQPWRFYVIEDTLLLNKLAGELPTASIVGGAPLAIVVCGDTTAGNPDAEQIFNWIMDCSAATQNILLAAHAMNLGAVWTGVFPYKARINVLRNILGIPPGEIPLSLIPIGYPASESQPKDKWDPKKVNWR